jgi:radical SAM superfamily enzyme YgiQ (UPF0313 family)/MoaA/NifB/PqqE/SkfB family radical SAM enzyme
VTLKPDICFVVAPAADVNLPPQEPAQAAAYLETLGFCPCGLDLNVDAYQDAKEKDRKLWGLGARDAWAEERVYEKYAERLGFNLESFTRRILDAGAPIIYFQTEPGNLHLSRKLAERIKKAEPNLTTIFGGPAARTPGLRALLLGEFADYVIGGELEPTLGELVSRLADDRPTEKVRGLVRLDEEGGPCYTPREPMLDLDVLGKVTYAQFPPDQYLGDAIPIAMSRGCAQRCAFCGEQPVQGIFRTRSAEAVAETMLDLNERWAATDFTFTDLVVDGDVSTLETLCEKLVEADKGFAWEAQIAPRAELTAETFAKMAEAGCKVLRFGVESLSDPNLERMNKTYTASEAIANIRDAFAAGIETHCNFIIGFPGETNQDFYDTARAIRDNQGFIDAIDTISACRIAHGCVMERNPESWRVHIVPDTAPGAWDDRGRNSPVWRNKRMREMAIYVSKLKIKFDYDFHCPPTVPLRAEMETRIRERFERHLRPTVLLVTTPPWGFENPPVSLAVLASYLKDNNVTYEVYDLNIEFYSTVQPIHKLLWHVENKNHWSAEETFEVVKFVLEDLIDGAVKKILEVNAPLVGFSVVDPKERMTIEIIHRLRGQGYEGRIILGGPACHTPDYRKIFEHKAGEHIDAYCIGEGEHTLLEAARRVQERRDLTGVPGLLHYDDHGTSHYTPRAPIEDLNSLPFPTYEDFDFSIYPGDSLIVEWSRGCIGSCTYCKGTEISGAYRTRSAQHIFDELKFHYETNKLKNFTVCDPLINGDPDVLSELCDQIIAYALPIKWNGEGIPRPSLTAELLQKMHMAGCYELQLGIECGSDNVLKRMNKKRFFTIEQAERVIRDTHEAGIKTCIFMIVGFPGETEEDFQGTLELIERNHEWIDQIKSINSLHVVTDTPLHFHADRFGIDLPETDYHYLWTDKNDMDWPERNARIRRVLAVAQKYEIEVRETNLAEGKQHTLLEQFDQGEVSMQQRAEMLTKQVNELQSFDAGDFAPEPSQADPQAAVPVDELIEEEKPPPPPRFANDEDKRGYVESNLQLSGVLDGKRVFAGPEVLEIDLTNACNSNCLGCWNHSDMLGPDKMTGEEARRRLPTEMLLKAIKQAAESGTKAVQLSGAGEPFMHPEIMDVIKTIKGLGLTCNIISNFTLVDEAKGKQLVDLGVDNLTISVWAGTPAMYKKTHPKLKAKTIHKIRDVLRTIHDYKAEVGTFRPHVKIYNVISKVNASGVSDMLDYAVSCLADYIEFTPVDIIPGVTDSLGLDDEARAVVLKQLNSFPRRDDYCEFDPMQGALEAQESTSLKEYEFARLIKHELLSDFFRWELKNAYKLQAWCPRRDWDIDHNEDLETERAFFFIYPKHECEMCPLYDKCPIDKETFTLKVEYLSFLGFGSFYRRITSPASKKGGYDSVVKDLPCLVGWNYARLLTNGDVIPCCKADDMALGNLYQDDFLKIWTAEKYRTFRAKAKDLPKDDPFFTPIGCLSACDNLGMNLGSMERIENLTDEEKEALEDREALGFEET